MNEARHINCCQKVLMANIERLGMTELEAEKLGAYFGGGMLKEQVCGAVTGAFMVMGAATDFSERQKDRAVKFLDEFEAVHGSLLCSHLKNDKEQCDNYIEWAIKELNCFTQVNQG